MRVVALVILFALVVVPAVGAQEGTGCEAVPPEVVARVAEGIKPETGAALRAAQAVRSPDHAQAWYVAADLEGPGLDGGDQIAVWLTNSIMADEPGMLLSVGSMATEFSDWPDGSMTDAQISITDEGAEAAEECVRQTLAA